MDEVIKLFKQIQDTNSLNDKKSIIIANKNNELFKQCLVFLLDKNVITGISSKKIKKEVKPSSELAPYYLCVHSTFEDVMNYLKENNTGKDDDIYEIQAFLYGHEEEREFYEQMITKKFRLGADAKLVNKCIPGLIPTFDVMLGTSIDKVKLKGDEWFSISQKLNGNRCIYYNGEFYTRQGKKYLGLEHIKRDIEKIVHVKDYVFDGELIYKNLEGLSDSEAFQKGTGIAQSKNDTKEELKLVLFDVLPKEEFESGISNDTYKKRKKKLISLQAFETNNLKIVDMFYEGTDQSEIWKWLEYAENNDFEGIMLSLDAPYECKRTKNLIKVKRFYDYDLQILDCLEGTGRNKGKLGAFVVGFKGNRVNVGAGFTDEERNKYWFDKDNLIGRIITVKYKEISKDKKTGLESLQFPIYCGLREQGKEISYN